MRCAERQIDVANGPIKRIAPALDDSILQRTRELPFEFHMRHLRPLKLLGACRQRNQAPHTKHPSKIWHDILAVFHSPLSPMAFYFESYAVVRFFGHGR